MQFTQLIFLEGLLCVRLYSEHNVSINETGKVSAPNELSKLRESDQDTLDLEQEAHSKQKKAEKVTER